MAEARFRDFTEEELYAVPTEKDVKPSPPKMSVLPETKNIPSVNLPSILILNTPERVVAPNGAKTFYQENKVVILLVAAVIIGLIGYTVYKASEERKKKNNN
jgi:hypothetical protein